MTFPRKVAKETGSVVVRADAVHYACSARAGTSCARASPSSWTRASTPSPSAHETTTREVHDVYLELRIRIRDIVGPTTTVLMHADPFDE